MNSPSENEPSKLARKRLAEVCRRMDSSARAAWMLATGEILLLAVLALALLDYWLILPVTFRAIGAGALASLVLFGLIRLVRFYRRPTRLKEGALRVESQRPELGCEISTSAEYLTGERKTEHEYEPELVAALAARSAQKLQGSELKYRPGLFRQAACFAATAIVVLALLSLAPGALTALQRTAVPFSKAHYTYVEVHPGDIEIPIGHNVAISNVFSGRPPTAAWLHWRPEGSTQWQMAALAKQTNGTYLYTLTNLQSDTEFSVSGSDAVSQNYKITTYVPPEVKELSIGINYPAYTKRAPVTLGSPEITAVRASTAELRIVPSVELSNARLRFSGLPELGLTPASDGSWSARLDISKDTDYWIALADKKGHPGGNERPYHIKALPDEPPKVEITEPGGDIRSAATNTVVVRVSASDDFEVEDIKLVFNKLGGPEQTITATREREKNNDVFACAELDLSQLDLKDYELVAYHAEARDNNSLDGPGIGKSPVYFVEITDEEGKPCLAQCQGQKVNLLVIQKQIIADTTALAPEAEMPKFQELSARQRDAAEFGRMYLDAITGQGPEAAATEMRGAIQDMESATSQLDQSQRAGALPPEESALAHLYQVVKLMPELGNLPTSTNAVAQKPPPDPKVKVVLEAIKQLKKEQPDKKELEDALEAARNLTQAQAGLNNAMRQLADSRAAPQGQTPAQNPSTAAGKNQGQKQGKGKGQGQGQGQGEGQGQAQAQAQGNGQGQGEGTPQNQAQQPPKGNTPGQPASEQNKEPTPELADAAVPEKPAEMAQKEEELSKEAADLAEKLNRMAGKDKRVGHNLGHKAGNAAAKLTAATRALGQGRVGVAGENGFQGELDLRNVVDQLERVLQNQPEPSDIANEDYPTEYETEIAEYLKKLSHQE